MKHLSLAFVTKLNGGGEDDDADYNNNNNSGHNDNDKVQKLNKQTFAIFQSETNRFPFIGAIHLFGQRGSVFYFRTGIKT